MGLKSTLLALILAIAASGQNGPPQNYGDQPDPEDQNHGVARISLMNGEANVRRGDSGDFVAGNLNAPLLSGDAIQTGQAARAEVQFDFANRVRLGAFSEIRLGDLRAGAIQIQVARGTITFSQSADSQVQIEISTPSASFRPMRRGTYRITVRDDGSTECSVRAGEADVFTQAGSQHVPAGQTMLLRGNPSDPEYQIIAGLNRDEWDQFNEARDRDLTRTSSYQHVSRDISGAEDLDQYGRWSTDPAYGDVWVPNVSADWAPYQSGRWAWEDYYGWTWVSYDPWGWAPYHYGRWYRGAYGWGWVPGPIYSRHYYRPALVGFFGFGTGVGFGFGFGNLGWVALAPFEPFHPWYGRGFHNGGLSHVNIVNNVNIYNTYRNARVVNGVMSMTSQQFQNGQLGRYSHPGAAQLQSAGAIHGQIPVAPGNSHLAFNNRPAAAGAHTVSTSQRFVSRGGFAPVQRQTFSQQRQAVQQSFSAPRAGQDSGQVRQASPVGRGIMTPGGGAATGPNNPSWQRFGSPSNPVGRPGWSASQRVEQPGGQPGSSWGRFGAAGQANSAPGPRTYTPNGSGPGNTGRSVQIAPSIVQQRPNPMPTTSVRPVAPSYSRPAQPSYVRPAEPSGARQTQPAYSRPSAPPSRPAAPASPARSSGNNAGHGSSGGGHSSTDGRRNR